MPYTQNPNVVCDTETRREAILQALPPSTTPFSEFDITVEASYPTSQYVHVNGILYVFDVTQAVLTAAANTVALQMPVPTPAQQTLQTQATLRQTATESINSAFAAAFETAIAGYPHEEVETWIYQADEAWDIVDQKSKPTPILDAIVAQTGEDIATLAASIVAKEAEYKLAIGTLVGKRHALINQVAAVDLTSPTAEADLAAIKWV